MSSTVETPTGTAAATSEKLAANYSSWSRQPAPIHVACVACLVAVALLRWWPALSNVAEPLGDEPAYRAAFRQVADGRSPYEGSHFLYPSVFAFGGAWFVEHLGLGWTVRLMRGANLAGLAVAVWCSMAWLPWAARRKLWVGAVYIAIAPQVSHSVLLGNLSLAIAGMVLAGLLLLPGAPLRSGFLLGSSIALKPVAPMALACLLFEPAPKTRRPRWIAVAAAGGLAAVLLLAFPHFDRLLELQQLDKTAASVSLHRFPGLFGLDISPLWISGPLALAALALLRRAGALGRARFLCFATTASLAVVPLVWSHTLVLALPLQVLALSVVSDRVRSAGRRRSPVLDLPWWAEPALVVLGVAAIQLSAAAGGLGDRSLVLQAVAGVAPAVAPMALLAYLLVHTEEF